MEGRVATWCSCSRLSPPFSLFSPRGFADRRGKEIWFHTEGQGSSTISSSHNTFLLAFLLAPNQTSSQTSSGFTALGKAFTMLKSHTNFIIPHLPFVQKKADKCIPPCSRVLLEGHGAAPGSPQRETASVSCPAAHGPTWGGHCEPHPTSVSLFNPEAAGVMLPSVLPHK